MQVRWSGKSAEAERELRAAITIRQRLVNENPAAVQFRADLCQTAGNFGIFLVENERLPEAEVEIRKALEIARKLVDENPSMTDFRSTLGWCHMFLSGVHEGCQ